jgi:hypothetical protein
VSAPSAVAAQRHELTYVADFPAFVTEPIEQERVFARKEVGIEVNVEGWKHLRPAPARGGNGIGAALSEAVSDRTGRIPEDMEALLLKLERRSGSTAQAAISKGWISPDK